MTQRTDTRRQTVFHHPDQGVTLDFVEQRKMKFTLAAGSGWRSSNHWHALHHGCQRITCLQGRMLVTDATPYGGSGSTDCPPGSHVNIKPRDTHVWSSPNPDQELVVLLETEDEILYRNTSSATLDATRYPFMSSTPLWIRLLYSLLAFSPAAQRLMIARLLWIQLQMMYFAHDFLVHHGSVHAPYLWWLTHPWRVIGRPPNWVFDIEWWSILVISKATQRACYWLGRLFLGMKAEYSEYTPVDVAATSRNVKISQERAFHETPTPDKAKGVDETSVD